MTIHMFISYSSRDREFAEKLSEQLRKHGVIVFPDRDFDPGSEWQNRFRDQIEKSSALVVLLPTLDAPSRNNVWFEAGVARALGKRVLAILPPNRTTKQLPAELADLVVLDTKNRPIEGIAATLVQAARP
jgi:TIR domain